MGAQLLPGTMGTISPEILLTRQPAVYVATGGSFGGRPGLRIGAGASEVEARASLARIVGAPPLSGLAAIHEGRAHGLWHGFNDNPAAFLAVEALARWIRPDAMHGLDPAHAQGELNARFAAVPMQGTYWVDLAAR